MSPSPRMPPHPYFLGPPAPELVPVVSSPPVATGSDQTTPRPKATLPQNEFKPGLSRWPSHVPSGKWLRSFSSLLCKVGWQEWRFQHHPGQALGRCAPIGLSLVTCFSSLPHQKEFQFLQQATLGLAASRSSHVPLSARRESFPSPNTPQSTCQPRLKHHFPQEAL